MLVYGDKESVIEDVSFEHIRFNLTDSKLNETAGGNIDLRGCLYPQQQLFKSDIPGLLAQYVKGLRINDFQLNWVNTRMPFFTHGIELHHFNGATITGFAGTHSPLNKTSYSVYATEGKGLTLANKENVYLNNMQ
jgi:hypothetical protein